MSLLRVPLRFALRRAYATVPSLSAFPSEQVEALQRDLRAGIHVNRDGRPSFRKGQTRQEERETPPKVKPESATFYTTKPGYYDQIAQIENAIVSARRALTALQLLPLPAFARSALISLPTVWKDKDDMSDILNTRLTTSRYRRVTTLLSQLNDYQRIALSAECTELSRGIAQLLEMFEKGNKEAVLARGKRKPVKFDEHGRSYTNGKRKTSSARVWMIPVHAKDPPKRSTVESSTDLETTGKDESVEVLLGLEDPVEPVRVTATTVLINNLPLAEYFQLPSDRERVIRPLKLAGVLGAYNVFALVRGGGTTGQSGAVAHGIARGLAAHEPKVQAILRRAKLMRRDPRMVERKKTGLAKARKAYTWVKR